MLFSVLGPLEVSIQGKAVSVGKNRQRIILIMLLANAGRTVTVGKLTEALWGGRPPRTAAEQVQTCIWRLRRSFALAGAPGTLIETTPSGYALRVEPEAVDAHRFTRQVEEARALTAKGDKSLAAAHFRAALAHFRGPVLAEVDSPTVQAYAAKWEERRLAVLEECIDLEIECGLGRQLIDELTVLVEQYPLNERLRARLMFALYCADRRADALEVYAEGRERLVDELGLEPGHTLRDMQRRILEGEPVASTPMHPPAQLLSDLPDFVDRPEHEQRIRAALTARNDAVRICGVYGNCGAGKSALAIHVAHRLREEFPGGQLYADLRASRPDPVDVSDVLSRFLHALGVPDSEVPAGRDERSALYRSLLDGQRVLIVLDDVPGSDSLCPLMPASPEVAVLMTSRSNLTEVPGIVPVEVGVFTVEQSVRLLSNVVGAHRITAEQAAVNLIVHATGRLPLSVRAAAARLAARSHLNVGQLAQRLSDPEGRLDELSYGSLDMRAYLGPSVDLLDGTTRRVWFAIGLLQVPDFGAWIVAAATDTPTPGVEPVLDHLVDRGLLEVVGTDHMGVLRYRMHRIMGLYARERGLRELSWAERAGLLDRAADCWLGLARWAEQLLSGVPEDSELLEHPDGPSAQMLDMVRSDPGGWLTLEVEGLRFAARQRSDLPGMRLPDAEIGRGDHETDAGPHRAPEPSVLPRLTAPPPVPPLTNGAPRWSPSVRAASRPRSVRSRIFKR
ncbi:AfsR/SARP family transcriptional regulator [Actinomadura formosensis]|uniref:AfsR/SARP family transcriptional regulator n=1 Tax=Actinomadura formosensis TaxID=60706 RepID=UPI00082F1769|nr:AfsR/SARP family transcriptional regulator [Actinomadura formosensis]